MPMGATVSDLGDLLRAKRAAASVESLPFASSGRRRVPGLRRDEIAVLAGVSVDYYTRLEQGRETNPSVQVLDALAHGLDLDVHERRYAYGLAPEPALLDGRPNLTAPSAQPVVTDESTCRGARTRWSAPRCSCIRRTVPARRHPSDKT
jgi:transcriptional regulator with XRE-family HTH domain